MTDVGDLVERGDALEAIEAALDSARGGSGALVVVDAPPMAGMSAVLEAAAAAAGERELAFAAARATPAGAGTTFGIARLLLAGAVEELDPERRRLVLAGAAGRAQPWLEGAYEPDESALVESLADLVTRLARELDGLLVTVDDAQDADAASLGLAEALASRIEGVPLALLVGVQDRGRRETVDRLLALPNAVRVQLPPLTAVGVEAWGARRFGAVPALARATHELTAGSPWLIDVVFESLEGEPFLSVDRDSLFARVPAIVAGRLAVELGGLDERARSVAEALAVIGEPADLRLVASVADLEPGDAGAGADALADARLVTPGEPLAFRQPILGTAVSARIAPFARAAMHRRAFEALAARGAPAEELALHLLHVPADADPASVETLRAAARAAAETDRREHGVALLRRALEEPPPEDTYGCVLAELAMAEGAAADPRGVSRLEEALARSDVSGRGELHVARAQLLLAQSDYGGVAAAVEAGLEELGTDHPLAEKLVLVNVIVSGLHPPLVPTAMARALPYIEAAIAGRLPDDPGMCAWLSASVSAVGGPPERVEELVDCALRESPLVDDSHESIYSFVRTGLMNIDHPERAEETATAAMARAAERGLRIAHDLAQHGRALARHRLGRLDESLYDAEACLPLRHAGWTLHASYDAALIVAIRVARGELEEAREALAIGHEHAGGMLERAHVLNAQSILELAEGDADAALASGLAAGEAIAALEMERMAARFLLWASTAAEAAVAAGQIERARSLAESELELVRESGLPGPIGTVLRAAALAVEGEARVDLLRESVEELRRSPARLELARSLIDLGAATRANGDRVGAREPLAAGLDLANRCGATVFVERAREELRLAGAKPRRAARTGPASLTPRERRIAELAAAGESNPEIAQSLVVSVRTVEGTLGRVYRKLDIGSREELAAALAS